MKPSSSISSITSSQKEHLTVEKKMEPDINHRQNHVDNYIQQNHDILSNVNDISTAIETSSIPFTEKVCRKKNNN